MKQRLGIDLPIELSGVSVCAGDSILLDQVSLTIDAGTPTVIIGPNGSGKTTLLRTAMGLLPASAGRVTWAGRTDLPPTRRAIVFQRPVMLRRSSLANVRFALIAAGVRRSERHHRAQELLRLVGLESLAPRAARRLSGGEQQRLALARALARDPDVLFLDEPTASLDPAATKSIEDIIRVVSDSGVKVVMATHDLGEARRLAGEIVLLHRGRIAESGPADVFFSKPASDEARRFLAGELLI
ncbi:MAG TPA: ATP-binding cassette domain-containing protein [Gammaproteobacteria bacterium]|nr:ATP-binding cassette domain-containing protein [Gammaproteobacteria bacterium]